MVGSPVYRYRCYGLLRFTLRFPHCCPTTHTHVYVYAYRFHTHTRFAVYHHTFDSPHYRFFWLFYFTRWFGYVFAHLVVYVCTLPPHHTTHSYVTGWVTYYRTATHHPLVFITVLVDFPTHCCWFPGFVTYDVIPTIPGRWFFFPTTFPVRYGYRFFPLHYRLPTPTTVLVGSDSFTPLLLHITTPTPITTFYWFHYLPPPFLIYPHPTHTVQFPITTHTVPILRWLLVPFTFHYHLPTLYGYPRSLVWFCCRLFFYPFTLVPVPAFLRWFPVAVTHTHFTHTYVDGYFYAFLRSRTV